MIFNVIKDSLLDNFYFSELDDNERLTINYMDIFEFDSLNIMSDLKKNVIRELRLSKLLDGENIDDKINLINEIEDPSIVLSKRSKSLGIGVDMENTSISVGNYDVDIDDKIVMDYEIINDDKNRIYSDVFEKVNDKMEEMVVSDYLKLSKINRVKMEQFDLISPMIVESNTTKILAKINTACSYIQKGNRKEVGNLVIINPIDYNKMKSSLDLLRVNIFQSMFMPRNEILVTIKSPGVEFHRVVYKMVTCEYTKPPNFSNNVKFEFSYGMGRTSIKPESNCVLISIN